MGQRITHASYLRHWALQLEVKVASVESSMSWPSGCGLQTPGLPAGLDCKEIQPVHSKGDQPWDFFGRNDAKAETPVLWPPYAKS